MPNCAMLDNTGVYVNTARINRIPLAATLWLFQLSVNDPHNLILMPIQLHLRPCCSAVVDHASAGDGGPDECLVD